jgi:hypothetical protein
MENDAVDGPDPYIATLVASLPAGWQLLAWGTEDG